MKEDGACVAVSQHRFLLLACEIYKKIIYGLHLVYIRVIYEHLSTVFNKRMSYVELRRH